MKKTPLTLLSALGAFALAATSAHGQSIFQETFDGLNPTFLNGQGGWTYTGGNANGSPNDALVIAGGLSYTNGNFSGMIPTTSRASIEFPINGPQTRVQGWNAW